ASFGRAAPACSRDFWRFARSMATSSPPVAQHFAVELAQIARGRFAPCASAQRTTLHAVVIGISGTIAHGAATILRGRRYVSQCHPVRHDGYSPAKIEERREPSSELTCVGRSVLRPGRRSAAHTRVTIDDWSV